jgi:hypothetical protein
MSRTFSRVGFSCLGALSLAATCIFFVSGCSQQGLEASVTGKVTLDGKPIGPGYISFVPAGETRNPAQGRVLEDGTYSVKTAHVAGLPPGIYQVKVSVHEPMADPNERVEVMPPLVHPEKYTKPEPSGLEYEVTSGPNTINIELKSE